MTRCELCGTPVSSEAQVISASNYCCDACLERARELVSTRGELDRTFHATLEVLVAALDVRECKTAEHSRRVARYSMILASELGVTGEACQRICRGALLHDIGKIGVPDRVLHKEGPLNDEEWDLMRRHPELGARILESIPFLSEEREIVLAHQERFDGSGYPARLVGKAIPLGARIFAVADVLDALTSERPYHLPIPFDEAVAEIERQGGVTLDPAVVSALLATRRTIREAHSSICVTALPE